MTKATCQSAHGYLGDGFVQESLMEDDDSIGADLRRSFCANSDLFSHHFFKGLRDLPDEVYELQDQYYQSEEFSP
ncbi:hypothetical protein [Oscillibacter sp.]|jgi:hypothetical protein|uniref:hypothetical protein n=1 Tax=Oscillibacter sp. TaxID=1945593 RepID=UPI00216E6713|nr:hypothetical protein [Oscillibacter sp.]MCI9113558.1 hypothetical protein [Oscillibacter sp.]